MRRLGYRRSAAAIVRPSELVARKQRLLRRRQSKNVIALRLEFAGDPGKACRAVAHAGAGGERNVLPPVHFIDRRNPFRTALDLILPENVSGLLVVSAQGAITGG